MTATPRQIIKMVNRPPKFQWLVKIRFPEYNFEKGIALAFADRVYSCETHMDLSFQIHEQTHLTRQRESVLYAMWWWMRYFFSAKFRYREELIAYSRQYAFICKYYLQSDNMKWLDRLAKQLSSPLYGRVTNYLTARNEILNESKKYGTI